MPSGSERPAALARPEVSFLLGSGISIPAGFPSVDDLTTMVLTATNVYQHTDRRYFVHDHPQPLHYDTRPDVERVQAFLHSLRQTAEDYYRRDEGGSPAINYEDLGAMTAQIEWSETGEWDNPALGPLISTLRHTYGDDLIHLATEATRYIRDVVAESLRRDCTRQGHLAFLTDSGRDATFGRCTIFTLNHDLLIEAALRAAGVVYTDGTEMSLRDRVEDALLLWRTGRREGAFLVALIAVAATARRRFPDRRDRDAFEGFLRSTHSVRLSVEYRGECHLIEHIFYKWFRCELVHEGGLPIDIQFKPDDEPGALSVRAGGAPEFILKVSEGWFHNLIAAVVRAPENRALFGSPPGAI